MMVADEVYDDKAAVDRGEEELSKALESFAAADVQLLNNEGFGRHVLKQWMQAVYVVLQGADSKHFPAKIRC